jgi:heptose I phosphotransferase
MTIGAGIIELEKRPDLLINRDYLSILDECGLLDFDRLYSYGGGDAVKRIKERSVTRMEIRHGDENRTFYLKRHVAARPGLGEMIGSFFSGRSPSPGMAEFENLCDFRAKGLPTVAPVAAGERRTGFASYESFLITESFEPYTSLEEIIYHHPERLQGLEGNRRKERLIIAIARLARRMHDVGFNHRDFNATHVLIGPEDENGQFPLALFDLQRMDRKEWLKIKWFIKIMAELSYTMPEPLFNDRDRLLLFQIYKGSPSLHIMDRIQLKWIRMKTERIRRHTFKIMQRRI